MEIFDINTTGMPYYDAMIQKGHIAGNRDPVEYFKTNKGVVFEIVFMSPKKYLTQSAKLHRLKTWKDDIQFIDATLVQKYINRTIAGSKMPMPILDYDHQSQEGRHRAVVAMELKAKQIPVLVVKTYKGN